MTAKLRVGVLRGGPSSEYAVSLKTGQSVLDHLPDDKYHPVDLFISKNGDWHFRGRPILPAAITDHVDVVWNALHGQFGEDGKVQHILGNLGVPYTGSGVFPSALGMHKPSAREQFSRAGMNVPRGTVVTGDDNVPERLSGIPLGKEYVVKPATGGSSVATRIVEAYPGLFDAVAEALEYGDALIEERVKGREATVGIVDDGDGGVFALPPVEIVPPAGRFFDYEVKYNGATEEICPGRFSDSVTGELRRQAACAHQSLGLRHYSRTDFIVTDDDIYVLEVNTLPGLTTESLLPKALRAAGVALPEFFDHVLALTVAERA